MVGCLGIGKIIFFIKLFWVVVFDMFKDGNFDVVFFIKFKWFNLVKNFNFCEFFIGLEIVKNLNDDVWKYII